METETIAALAARDQADAREREFDRAAQRWAIICLAAFLPFAVYAILGAYGIVPPMPWSPMGAQ